MNSIHNNKHAITTFFSLVLFGIFVLLMLMLLLSSAEVYQASVAGTEENYQLRTTMSYLTTKLRQHDADGNVTLGTVGAYPAICLKDTISDRDYTTYIYLEGQDLKELFAASDLPADPLMGTTLTSMEVFDCRELSNGLYEIRLTDSYERSGTLYFHAGVPK